MRKCIGFILSVFMILSSFGIQTAFAAEIPWKIQPQFAWVKNFSEGLAAASLDGHGYGFIDKTGKFVIEPIFGEQGYQRPVGNIGHGSGYGYDWDTVAYAFVDGIAPAWTKDTENGIQTRCGYIDRTGKVVIDFKYKSTYAYNDGLAVVIDDDDKKSVINTKGEVVFSEDNFKIDSNYFSDGIIRVRRFETLDGSDKEYVSFADKSGKIVFDVKGCYPMAVTMLCNDGIIGTYKTAGEYIVLNNKGEIAFKVFTGDAFDVISPYSGGVAIFEDMGEFWIIDKQGKKTNRLIGYSFSHFSEGIVLGSKKDAVQIFNQQGEVISEFPNDNSHYENTRPESHDGMIAIYSGSLQKWGFVANPLAQTMNQSTLKFTSWKQFDSGHAVYYELTNQSATIDSSLFAVVFYSEGGWGEIRVIEKTNLSPGETYYGYFGTQYSGTSVIDEHVKAILIKFENEEDRQNLMNSVPHEKKILTWMDYLINADSDGEKWFKDKFGIDITFRRY